ncbi:MAG: hypothetical protein KDB18_08335, partial [Salinibacterium sp.]|nr:hypothetical protein [Salinibacterium sp.]
GYRSSGLEDIIITEVVLRLRPGPKNPLRERQREVAARKKATQPLAAKSAGCCFKNPVLDAAIDGIGDTGQRAPAGMLIDRAGGKQLAVGGASVSEVHANFIVTTPQAKARDVIELMDSVRALVAARFNVLLEREVVVWSRQGFMA